MSALFIDAMEQHDVAGFDVLGAYLQTEIPSDKRILLRIRKDFFNIMCEFNTDHKPYVQYDNGKKVIYVKVLRAIYGFISSAILW